MEITTWWSTFGKVKMEEMLAGKTLSIEIPNIFSDAFIF